VRVAIIHDWLVSYGGSERVLEQILCCYPEADLFSIVDFLGEEERGFIGNKFVTTSFIQHLPFARKKYRQYISLMPLAIEQLDVSSYDVVISSSHAVAKGVLTGPDQLHISYVHSPIRYAWDLQHQYLKAAGLDKSLRGWLARWMLHKMRQWDVNTANGIDVFIANSYFIARRIEKVYRRKSTVIYPPVDLERFGLCDDKKQDYYLTASRMVPYKRIDLVVDAFTQMPERKLLVIGEGPEFNRIRTKAGRNTRFLGYQPTRVLRDYMQRAKAFIFAAEEDFGIVPVEAQACGTPVITYGKGGVLETVVGGVTGLFFWEQTPEALVQAVKSFETRPTPFDPMDIRRNAERFSTERFRREFYALVEQEWDLFRKVWGMRVAKARTKQDPAKKTSVV